MTHARLELKLARLSFANPLFAGGQSRPVQEEAAEDVVVRQRALRLRARPEEEPLRRAQLRFRLSPCLEARLLERVSQSVSASSFKLTAKSSGHQVIHQVIKLALAHTGHWSKNIFGVRDSTGARRVSLPRSPELSSRRSVNCALQTTLKLRFRNPCKEDPLNLPS